MRRCAEIRNGGGLTIDPEHRRRRADSRFSDCVMPRNRSPTERLWRFLATPGKVLIQRRQWLQVGHAVASARCLVEVHHLGCGVVEGRPRWQAWTIGISRCAETEGWPIAMSTRRIRNRGSCSSRRYGPARPWHADWPRGSDLIFAHRCRESVSHSRRRRPWAA